MAAAATSLRDAPGGAGRQGAAFVTGGAATQTAGEDPRPPFRAGCGARSGCPAYLMRWPLARTAPSPVISIFETSVSSPSPGRAKRPSIIRAPAA